jgi:DNA topoisomerase-2
MLALLEKAPKVVKPRGRGPSKKAPAKVCSTPIIHSAHVEDVSVTYAVITFPYQQEKPTLVLNDDDEDDEVLELKERLAAYNLESSPDQSAGNVIGIYLFDDYDLYTIFHCCI